MSNQPWTAPDWWHDPEPGCSWIFQGRFGRQMRRFIDREGHEISAKDGGPCRHHNWQYRHVGRLPGLTPYTTRLFSDIHLALAMWVVIWRTGGWCYVALWWWRPVLWFIALRLFGRWAYQYPPRDPYQEH